MIWLIIIPGALLVLAGLGVALAKHSRWEQDKRDHRRWGGTAPKK